MNRSGKKALGLKSVLTTENFLSTKGFKEEHR